MKLTNVFIVMSLLVPTILIPHSKVQIYPLFALFMNPFTPVSFTDLLGVDELELHVAPRPDDQMHVDRVVQ